MKANNIEEKLNRCMELSADLWNEFKSIESKHPLDESEMRRDIHDIQNRLCAIANTNKVFISGLRQFNPEKQPAQFFQMVDDRGNYSDIHISS